MKLALVPVVRNHPGSVSPRIKSNNLLNNALAMQQAYARGGYEALMRNHRGEICECAQSNVFLVTNRCVRTPPLDAGLLAGVTRAFVLELARGLGAARARRDDSTKRSSPAPTSSSSRARRRRSSRSSAVDDLVIGDGSPGAITRTLRAAFAERTAAVDASARQV